MFWLNCNIFTCFPTFFISLVLPHTAISLAYPSFNIPYSKPWCHSSHHHKTISFSCSPLHAIQQYPQASPTTSLLPPLLSHWYPGLSPTTFTCLLCSASWACSKLRGCWLAGQLLPLACKQFPVLLLLGQQMAVSGAQWGSCRNAPSLYTEQKLQYFCEIPDGGASGLSLKRKLWCFIY